MTLMDLATDVEDPSERLKAINRSSTLAKQHLSSMPAPVVKNYAALFMGPFVGANIVGLGGIYQGAALSVGPLTIGGRVCIGFTGDRDASPHLQRLAVYTGDAFEELERAHAGRATRASPAAVPKTER